jgi:hypothetical protein
METSSVNLYPLRENIESFLGIYNGILDGIYEKSYMDTLLRLSKVFYDSIGEVIVCKHLLKQKYQEYEDPNACELTKLCVGCEIFSLNEKLDYLLSRKSDLPYDDSYSESSQDILNFYFDSLKET